MNDWKNVSPHKNIFNFNYFSVRLCFYLNNTLCKKNTQQKFCTTRVNLQNNEKILEFDTILNNPEVNNVNRIFFSLFIPSKVSQYSLNIRLHVWCNLRGHEGVYFQNKFLSSVIKFEDTRPHYLIFNRDGTNWVLAGLPNISV